MNTNQTDSVKKQGLTKKVFLVIGGVFIFFIFISSIFTEVEPDVPKQPANMEAIRAELNAYATEYLFEESEPDRWVDVVANEGENGILIRVSTNPEVPTNEVAAQTYCDKIGEILSAHAPDHKDDADVFIYQYGEIVKACTY
ncbi:MAG: hypothetical protein H6779_02540 [Candidatus Nomurabacteria bacterium]|nr:hypothetical protein [Candidatus Nomurabacteria bacterium]USN87267.1 MAG: hypothetical protein H6779_02540 [Candidatus Nomurabacteria bacterium]